MSVSPLTEQSRQSTGLQLYSQDSQTVSPLESSPTTSLGKRFSIPTKAGSLSSGFPYHPRLHDLNVSMDDWHLFTNDILNAGKLTPAEDYAAWSTGIATGAVALPFILVFGPVAGYYAGKSVHRKVVVSKVKERLLKDGGMRSVLRRWNEHTFAERGFQAWLELPIEGNPVPINPGHEEKKTKDQKKAAKMEKRRFKIVIIPDNNKFQFSPSSIGSLPQTPQQTAVVSFAEAPGNEHRSPMEMHTGSSDHIQPLVNHQQAIEPEGDRKYEYRPVPTEIKPGCDTTPLEKTTAEQSTSSPSGDVADGRIPTSEMIPPDEKKGLDSPDNYPSTAFEMEGGELHCIKQG